MRIGTAEIYRSLAAPEEIEDSLILNLDLPGGKFFMPLFGKGTAPEKAANRAALADPQALGFFVTYAREQTDYPRP